MLSGPSFGMHSMSYPSGSLNGENDGAIALKNNDC